MMSVQVKLVGVNSTTLVVFIGTMPFETGVIANDVKLRALEATTPRFRQPARCLRRSACKTFRRKLGESVTPNQLVRSAWAKRVCTARISPDSSKTSSSQSGSTSAWLAPCLIAVFTDSASSPTLVAPRLPLAPFKL